MLCLLCAVRAVLAERGDNPALAAQTAEQLKAAWEAGENSSLRRIMNAFSRPTRIVRGKAVDPAWQVRSGAFQHTHLFHCLYAKNTARWWCSEGVVHSYRVPFAQQGYEDCAWNRIYACRSNVGPLKRTLICKL